MSGSVTRRGIVLAVGAGAAIVAMGGKLAMAADEKTVAVGGEVEEPKTFTAADLAAMPQVEVKGAWSDNDDGKPFTAKGPLLYDVINACKPNLSGEMVGRSGVVVTGSDGYQSVFAWGEIAPDSSAAPVIVAVEFNGEPLRSIFLPAWVVSANDKPTLRSVFSLAKLDLVNLAGGAGAEATPTA
ncbi:MAG: hypothetical protein ACR2J8_11665 [Thermomicrobiales bacterium]